MKKITTTTVGKHFAESNWVLLEQTPDTLLIFKPEVHSGGVRGFLVRYKKERGIEWAQVKDKDFEKIPPLKPKTSIEVELTTEAVSKLRQAIEERLQIAQKGIQSGTKEYVVEESSKVIIVDDPEKRSLIINRLLEGGFSDEFWNLLKEREPELATRLSVGHLYSEKSHILEELQARLRGSFPETSGPDSWQRWIYSNNWLFGTNYVQTVEKAKISISGSMPDYLFFTADYFADVLEIKLPGEDVIVADPNHPGAYKWCPKTNEAIGQVVAYISDIGRLRSELEREISRVYGLAVSFVRPRGYILIGRKDGWNKYKLEAFRNLNFALHGVEVLTYDDLVQRGREIVQMYRRQEGQK